MFSDCPMESLLSVSGTAVGGLQREEELGRPSSPGFRFPSPLLIRLMPSLCVHISGYHVKCPLGEGKLSVLLVKKEFKITFLYASSLAW